MHKNRVALITSSTSGIGKAIAQRLAEDGFTIAFHSRSTVAQGEALASSYPKATYNQVDLAKQDQVNHLITDVLSRHGRLDVLVNNAGISAMIPHHLIKQASAEIWRQLYEVNVIAPWTLITQAEQALRSASTPDCRSCILNISSHAGIRPKGASIPYAASKAALNHMTRMLALSLAPEIRVNAIAPGLVDTPMTEHWTDARKLWREKSPMKRGQHPKRLRRLRPCWFQAIT